MPVGGDFSPGGKTRNSTNTLVLGNQVLQHSCTVIRLGDSQTVLYLETLHLSSNPSTMVEAMSNQYVLVCSLAPFFYFNVQSGRALREAEQARELKMWLVCRRNAEKQLGRSIQDLGPHNVDAAPGIVDLPERVIVHNIVCHRSS